MAKPVLVDLDFGGTAKATGLPAPTLASDAVTKAYVDALTFNYGRALALGQGIFNL